MEFDAHLMVTEPSGMIPAFAQAGVDAITVHCGSLPAFTSNLAANQGSWLEGGCIPESGNAGCFH